MNPQDWMAVTRTRFEADLAQYGDASDASPLTQAMRYALLGGGKRIRALLVFAAGELFEADAAALLPVAAALEMIHAYSLVHDDLPCMDDDTLRRGQPTAHVVFGQALALLAGDALQTQAFATLAQAPLSAEKRIEMVALLAQASGRLGMCGGQAIDLTAVGKTLTQAELEQMHRLKTGALLRAAVLLGMMAGRASTPAERAALSAYADALGLAFQVQDDVLDASENSATLGKTAGKDAAANKPNYVALLGLSAARDLAHQLCRQAQAALTIFDGVRTQTLISLAERVVMRKA